MNKREPVTQQSGGADFEARPKEEAYLALAESNERLRLATATARDAMVTIDGRGLVTGWNPAAHTMFGFSSEEIMGQPLHLHVVPLRFRDEAAKGMAHFSGTGEGPAVDQTREMAALHKDGHEFPIEISLSRIHSHGEWQAFGVVRDITERKEREQTQSNLANERKFHAVFEKALDGNVLIAADGKIMDCNLAFEQQSRRTKAELRHLHVWDLEPRQNAGLSRPNFYAFWNAGGGAADDCALRRPDTTVLAVEMRSVLITFDGQQFMHAMTRDISRLKSAEANALRLTGLYNTLLNCNRLIAHCNTPTQLFSEICEVLVGVGGITLAWIGLLDAQARQVKPTAWSGAAADYLKGIEISMDPASPHGGGPVYRAIQSRRPYWVEDFQTDAACAPWRERGARYAWGSAAAFPLQRAGAVVGVLALYTGQVSGLGGG